MYSKTFFIPLIIVSIISLITIVLFQQFVLKDDHQVFLFLTLAFFIISSFFVHSLAMKAAQNQNKYAFSRLTMANSFVKLFALVGFVVVYHTVYESKSIDFVFPFILIYLFFTIFETRYLLKLAKS